MITKTCRRINSPAVRLRPLDQALSQIFLLALLFFPTLGHSQQPVVVARSSLVKEIALEHIGPKAASDEFILAHIRLRKDEQFRENIINDDIESLMGTNFFLSVDVVYEPDRSGAGWNVRYILRGQPTVTEIRFDGNSGRKFRRSKLMRKMRSRVGDTFNGLALASDRQTIEKEYNKAGYHQAVVEMLPEHDDDRGQVVVTFKINPGQKVKIDDIIFEKVTGGENKELAFTQRQLRKVLKTRRHWWMSWLTGSGKLEEDQWDTDMEDLKKFYQSHGYIDFRVEDEITTLNERGNRMAINLKIFEGFQYRVGDVTFEGNTVYTNEQILLGRATFEYHVGPRMRRYSVFTPNDRLEDAQAIRELYEMEGYLDVDVQSEVIPNTGTGEIDLHYTIVENEKIEVERIEIRGNTTTKDKVIRRELNIYPGETFNMVDVNLSKRRLEGTGLFEKVEPEVEQIEELPNKRNLIIGVTEGRTGNIMMGFGYGSIMSLYAQIGYTQGNFDLFNPPFFTGGGQKFRLQVTAGRRHEDYMITFEEPFLFDKKLRFAIDLYHRDNRFLSHYFTQKRTGARVGLSRTLWDDYTYGGVNYTIEQVGIHDRSYYTWMLQEHDIVSNGLIAPNSPKEDPFKWNYDEARKHEGEYAELNHDRMVSKLGTFITYSTLNHALMPNRGQHTQFTAEVAGGPFGGETEMYQLELESSYYFPGLMKGHVLELVGRVGVVDSFGGSSRVPYFDRFFLGGTHTMRGYDYRDIGPRLKKWKLGKGIHEGAEHYGYYVDIKQNGEIIEKDKFIPVHHASSDFPFNGHQAAVYHPAEGTTWSPVVVDGSEPLGGSSYWFGSAEYTIPIIPNLRFALFYDIGMSYLDPYEFELGEYADNWGLGLRLTVPMLGPLRLDYGFPITHPDYVDGGGEFHFGVGYNRSF